MKIMKKWLISNSEIIDIISKLIFGFASIIVGISSVIIAGSAVKIQEKSVEVASYELAAHLYVRERYSYNEDSEVYEETVLEVFNSGGEIYNYSARVLAYIECSEYFMGRNVSINIPLNGYYFESTIFGNPSGIISKHSGYKNNSKFIELIRESESKNFRSERPYMEIARKTIVVVEYMNKLGEFKTEYFLDSNKISNPEEVLNIMEVLNNRFEFRNGVAMFLDIDDIDLDSVMKIYDKEIKEESE